MRLEHRVRCVNLIMDRGKLSKAQANKLIDAGYQTGRRIREVTDQELLAIEGIGRGTLKKIRAWVGK